MKGLIKKELYLLRTGTGLLFLLASLLFAAAAAMDSDSVAAYMAMPYVLLSTFSLVSLEQKWRWDTYIQCGPVSRLQVVLAKYLVTLGQLVVTAAVWAVISLALNHGQMIPLLLTEMGVTLVSSAIMLPLIFWAGADNGWVGMLCCLILLGSGGTVGALMYTGYLGGIGTGLLFLALGTLLYFLSCPLAAKAYAARKK